MMFLSEPDFIAHECWIALQHIFEIPNLWNSICDELCPKRGYKRIVLKTYPDISKRVFASGDLYLN
jgi:hypothetical protein